MTKLQFVDSKQFKEADDTDGLAVRKQYIPETKSIDKKNRTIDFIISTDTVDRHKDTVSVSGWDFKSFKKNPVVLWAHDGGTPPIAKARNIRRSDGKLKAKAEFTDEDLNPFGAMIFNMFVEGFMNAVSVGFIPKEWERVDAEAEPDRPWGLDFKKQELLEFSAVPVPANPDALIDARSVGIDTQPMKEWCEQALDQWEERESGIVMPRKQVEILRKLADGRVTMATQVLDPLDQDELLRRNLEATKQAELPDDLEIVEPEPDEESVEASADDESVEKADAARTDKADAARTDSDQDSVDKDDDTTDAESSDVTKDESQDDTTKDAATDVVTKDVDDDTDEVTDEQEPVDGVEASVEDEASVEKAEVGVSDMEGLKEAEGFDEHLELVELAVKSGFDSVDDFIDSGSKLGRKQRRSVERVLTNLVDLAKEFQVLLEPEQIDDGSEAESKEADDTPVERTFSIKREDESGQQEIDVAEEKTVAIDGNMVADVMKEVLPSIVKGTVDKVLAEEIRKLTGKLPD